VPSLRRGARPEAGDVLQQERRERRAAGASLRSVNTRNYRLCPGRARRASSGSSVLLAVAAAQLCGCQAWLPVLRRIGGAGGLVFSSGDDCCTCMFVVVTQELQVSFLGCIDCICFAVSLTLSISRPFRKK